MKTVLHFYLYIIFILLTFSIQSNAQTWNWANNLGSVTGSESANDVAVDNQGNVYVVGTFTDTIQTPLGIIISTGNQDIFIAKYDSTGNLLWTQSTGGVNSESVKAVDVDNSGNIFLTGEFTGNATFGGTTVVAGQGTNAIYIAKYDTNGNFQWVKTGINNVPPPPFGSFGNLISDIKTDTQGNIYVGGQSENPISFGSTTISNSNNTFLVKYDTNGNLIFGINVTAGIPLKLQVNNNKLYTLTSSPGKALRVVKYDLLGVLLTTSPSLITFAYSPFSYRNDFTISTNEDITILTNFQLSASTAGSSFLVAAGNPDRDILLAQFTNTGTFKWAKQLESATFEIVGGISSDTSNNIYISGSFDNTMTIDTTVLQSVGQDIFTAKLTPSGSLEWARVAGSGNTDANSNFINIGGDVYVVGNFFGTANFDNIQITSNGFADVYVAKLGCEPRPVTGIIGDTLVCLGTTTYQAINNSLGNNFIWTISGGGTLINNGNTATINWTQTGLYTITVTQVNECGVGEAFNIEVNVKDIPVLPVINGDNTDCLGSATYNITNNASTDTYNWTLSGGGNLFPLGNTAIVNWAVTGIHTLSVSTSNLCGTSPTGNINIDIDEIPSQPSPIIGNTNVCQSTQTYTIPAINSVNYTWSLSSGGAITSVGGTSTINWTTAGTHTLSVTPFNDCGTGSTRSILVTVTETPQQPSTVVGDLTVCQGLQSYSVVGNTSVTYNWTISGGGSISPANNNATVNWTTPGTYTMTITPSNVCGTGTPRTVNINVLDVPTQPVEILGIDTVCIGTQNYSVSPQAGVNFSWTLSGGGTVLPSNNIASINWTTPGTHTITVTPLNSCGSGQSKSRLVFVKNTTAQITNISGEDEPCLNIENYSVPSISGLTYNWNVTGGGTITDLGNSAFVDWDSTGIYTLSVSTSDGCTNSLTVSVDDVPDQPSQIFGDTTTCLSFYNYSVLNTPDVNYTWTVSGGGILTQSGSAANMNWTSPGTYTLSAVPSNSCGLGTPQNQIITVLDIPAAPSTITSVAANDTLACLNTETYAVNAQAGSSYNWSLSGNGTLLQNANSVNITWLTPSIDNEIIVTTSNICGASPQQSLKVDVLDIPQVAPIQGNDDVCLNTAEFYVVPLVNENSYTWSLSSGGVLNIVNDTAFVTWQTLGIHTLSVTPSNLCGNGQTQTLQVNVKTIPNQPTGFTGNVTPCQATLEGYNVIAVTDVNYNWALSGGGSLVAFNNSANINWTAGGNHTLTITPSNQCGFGIPFNQTINTETVPTAPSLISGVDSTCLNTSNTFAITPQVGSAYNWILSNGGIVNANNDTATINWNGTGNQTLSVSLSNICGTSISTNKNITVLDVPTQPSISGDLDVCLNDTEIYIATSNATNYIWTTSGGVVNANAVTWTNTGSQILTVIPSNFCGNGLSASMNIQVENIPNLTANITGDSVVCTGIRAYSLPQVNNVTYTWSISGGGSVSAINNIVNINWTTAGTYTVTAVPSNDCGAGNAITKQVTVRGLPTISNTIQGSDTSCIIQSNYTLAAQAGITYNWSLGSGGVIAPINNNSINIIWTNAGTHTITVTPEDVCGTLGTPITKIITVIAAPQLSAVIDGANEVCNGELTSYFIGSNIPSWTYNWAINNGNTLTTTGNNLVSANFNTIGSAILSVTASNQCGTSLTESIVITVEDNSPDAVGDIIGDTIVCRNSDASYTITVNPDFDYNWILDGGGSISTSNNSGFITWQSAGIFKVGVFASNFCGIGDTIFKTITVEAPLQRPEITFSNDTLYSSNPTASQWYFNGQPIQGATNFAYRPANQAIYTVESSNICGVSPLSNGFSFGIEGGFYFYPNPATQIVTLRIPSYLTWYSITAVNSAGREVLSPIEYNGTNEVQINISGLGSGVHWFRIDTELLTFYRELVIAN